MIDSGSLVFSLLSFEQCDQSVCFSGPNLHKIMKLPHTWEYQNWIQDESIFPFHFPTLLLYSLSEYVNIHTHKDTYIFFIKRRTNLKESTICWIFQNSYFRKEDFEFPNTRKWIYLRWHANYSELINLHYTMSCNAILYPS